MGKCVGRTDGWRDKRNLKGRKGVPWLGKVCRARGPPTCTEGGQCQTSVLPRRASATAPCSAGPLRSATRWWTPPCTWRPAPRTCVAAPPALVPPLRSTPASVPTRGDSPRTGGARTSAVSGPRPGPAPGPTPKSAIDRVPPWMCFLSKHPASERGLEACRASRWLPEPQTRWRSYPDFALPVHVQGAASPRWPPASPACARGFSVMRKPALFIAMF